MLKLMDDVSEATETKEQLPGTAGEF